jgi:pimeloyl-ACP methyl ester carboxylesterase
MYYVEAGTGDPLVLIMGLGGDHLAWAFQMPAFSERYRVIAFDNRGVGQTDQPDQHYTTTQMAADTVGLMDVLGIARAHVLGVSMGGMIAQEVALNHPHRVRTLQLHCTYARPDACLRGRLAAARAERIALSREDALRSTLFWLLARATYNERPEFVEAIVESALANPYPQSLTGFLRQAEACLAHDAVERLHAVRAPTLVTAAAEDLLVPPVFSREVATRIPAAEFRLIEGAAHAYFWERADAFNGMCLEFLAAHATA